MTLHSRYQSYRHDVDVSLMLAERGMLGTMQPAAAAGEVSARSVIRSE